MPSSAYRSRKAAVDCWIVEGGLRGAGRLVGRITPAGERRFYFRYTGPDGQVRLSIGAYDRSGDGTGTFTVAQARAKALELSSLYRSGVRDLHLHQYFVQQAHDAKQSDKDSRAAAEIARRNALEQQQAAAAERDRRITLRKRFDRWRTAALQPRLRADGKRTGARTQGNGSGLLRPSAARFTIRSPRLSHPKGSSQRTCRRYSSYPVKGAAS